MFDWNETIFSIKELAKDKIWRKVSFISARKLYYNVEQDATIKFSQALHFVGQVNLRTEVRRLSDRAYEQLSKLIVAPLTNREVQVRDMHKNIFLLTKMMTEMTILYFSIRWSQTRTSSSSVSWGSWSTTRPQSITCRILKTARPMHTWISLLMEIWWDELVSRKIRWF